MKHLKYLAIAVMLLSSIRIVEAQQIGQIEVKPVGNKIQVTCELQSNTPLDLYLLYSEDGQVFKPCATVSGDILRQTSGRKTILWDYASDGIIMGELVFKVYSVPAEITATENESKTPDPANKRQDVQQDELRFLDIAGGRYEIHNSSGRKLSNSEIRSMLAYSPDALSYYNRGKGRRAAGYTAMAGGFLFDAGALTFSILSLTSDDIQDQDDQDVFRVAGWIVLKFVEQDLPFSYCANAAHINL